MIRNASSPRTGFLNRKASWCKVSMIRKVSSPRTDFLIREASWCKGSMIRKASWYKGSASP